MLGRCRPYDALGMTTDLRFDGRVVVITGAGRGMGREHALLLAGRGARVVVNDFGGPPDGTGRGSTEPATAVCAEIEAAGGTAIADGHSVATSAGGEAIIQTALEAWGRVDAVVHNAGVGGAEDNFDGLTDDQLDRVIGTHLFGAFHVLRPAWRTMEAAGYGRIVVIASAMALGATWAFDYSAAKGGLVSLTRSLALAGASRGIKANAVMPMAWTRLSATIADGNTREWMKANFEVHLVSPAVAWLCHQDVEVNGETFSVGGGRVGRVFYGTTQGYHSDALTPEEIRDNVDTVMSLDGFAVASSSRDDAEMFRASATRKIT